MLRLLKTTMILTLMCLLVGPALAQERGQGRGGRGGGFGGGPGMLIQNSSVQKELKLSDDEIKKIKEAVDGINSKHQEERAALRNLQGDERREKGQELGRKVTEETNQALASILTPEQSKRLKEITLQQEGARAFNGEEVQKALKLTDDQKDKIKTINEDAAKDMRELFPQGGRRGAGGAGGGGAVDAATFKEMQTKMAAIRKETLDKVTSVLTDDQKKAWKDMTGAPFEVKFEPRQGGRRGGDKAKEKDK
jgi:Spy/CpxP family protein refolding chaperone